MKPRGGRLYPLFLVAFLAAITFWLERVVELPEAGTHGTKGHEPDFTVRELQLTQINKQGAADTALSATKMIHFADDESTDLVLPRLVQQKKGEPPLHIAADRGTVDKDGNIVRLYDDVVATRGPSRGRPEMRLETSFMEVHIPEEVGTTPAHVRITQGHSHIEGVGMVFRNQTREFELHADVQGSYLKEPQ